MKYLANNMEDNKQQKKQSAKTDNQKVSDYMARLKFVEKKFDPWIKDAQDIAENILFDKGMFDGEKPFESRTRGEEIINDTAGDAIDIAAAGMQSHLTSPARPWFRMAPKNEQAKDHPFLKWWWSEAERHMYSELAESNFYTAIHGMYKEQLGFGMSPLYIGKGVKTLYSFKLMTAGEYFFEVDEDGNLDTMFRYTWQTAKQLVDKFDYKNVGASVKNAYDTNKQYELFKIIHVVEPNLEHDVNSLSPKKKAFLSVYFEATGDKNILRESGFDEFPFICPPWDTNSDETTGTGPGKKVKKDVKMLQEMEASKVLGIHLGLTPPVNIPSSMRSGVSLFPGGENYYDNPDAVIKEIYRVNQKTNEVVLEIQNVEQRIARKFFNDLFLFLNSNPNATATEVMERHEEKLLLLGPVVERILKSLTLLLSRCFNVLLRSGKLPPIPEELQEMVEDYDIEFTSILAQAQKSSATQTIAQTIQFIEAVGAVNQEAIDKLDADAAIDAFGDARGTPVKIIKTSEQVAEIRDARAKQLAEEQKIKQAAMVQAAQGEQIRQAGDTANAMKTAVEAGKTGIEADAMGATQ